MVGGGAAQRAGWIRIVVLAALGAAAITAFAHAVAATSMPLAVLGSVLSVLFVAVTLTLSTDLHVSPRDARSLPDGPGAAIAVVSAPAAEADAPGSADDVPAEPPALAPAPARAERIVRMPPTMNADVVALALIESAASAGEPIAAHIWLQDPASATLRRVAAVGTMVPASRPLPLDDDPLGLACRDGAARMTAVAAIRASGETTTLWRFAVPVEADGARGVAGIDFHSTSIPDATVLVELTAALRGALTGCLALHVAHKEIETARMLLETARDLSRRLDPEEVVARSLSTAVNMSDAATGSLMLLDPDTGLMSIEASVGLPERIVQETRVKEGEGIAGWVLATRQPVLIEDLPGRASRSRRSGVRSAVSVPVADEDGILGVLNVGSREYPARFTDAHLEALRVLGTQTAVALRNARALNSARDLYFATLRALALAMETKDPYARGGTDKVVLYTTALGNALGLDEIDMQSLEVAALLHDIGMNASSDVVSTGSRPLSTFERGLLKLHPVLAAEVLQEVPALHNVIPIVYHHHEWFDGHGYVVGLAGESIPISSRILAVADAFTAMTSERPYRAAMPVAQALAELEDKAGSQFDPQVVEAFVDLMRRDPSLAPQRPAE